LRTRAPFPCPYGNLGWDFLHSNDFDQSPFIW
jgi:hypothetical protein